MEIADKALSALANIFQVVAVLTAATVFFTSREKTEKLSRSILSAASWAAKNGWLAWLKRASVAAYTRLEIFYGPRTAPTRTNLFGYLTRQSLTVSFRLATLYLTLGVPLIFFASVVLYGVFQRNDGGAYVDLAVALVVVLCTGGAALFELKKTKRIEPLENDKLKVLIYSLLYGCVFPMALLVLFSYSYYEYGGYYFDATLAAATISLCLYFSYKAISRICTVFGFYTPIGVIFYVALSFPILPNFAFLLNDFAEPVGKDYGVINYVILLSDLMFVFSCVFYLAKSESYRKKIFLVMYFILVANTVLIVSYESSDPFSYLFSSKNGNASFFSLCMLLGTVFAMATSVIYANAICDWLSVGVTRYLTLITSKSRNIKTYAALIGVDCVFAATFFTMTLLVFSLLVHLYVVLSLMPADEYLYGLRSTILASDTWWVSDLHLEEYEKKVPRLIGSLSGGFVKIFAFTALIPTMFHALMVMIFALIKLMGRFFYGPAIALSQRWEEALTDGKSAVMALHRAIYGGFVFAALSVVFTVGYILSVIVT